MTARIVKISLTKLIGQRAVIRKDASPVNLKLAGGAGGSSATMAVLTSWSLSTLQEQMIIGSARTST
jgi:hypothetical protein